MKNIKLLSLILLLSLFVLSCEDDLLNKTPVDTIATTNYYKSQSDFQKATIGIYDAFQTFADNDYLTFTELHSDNAKGAKQADRMVISNDDPSLSTGITNGLWSHLYKMIYLSNLILDKIDDIEFTDTTIKNQTKGEALFFRGLSHYYVGKFFGKGVRLSSTMSVENSQHITALDNQTALFEQAASDLSKATELLPVSGAFGRATKYVAEGFLADYYMFTNKPEQAQPLLEDVLKNSGASFEPIFSNIFAADQNQEIIFAATFSAGNDYATSYPQTFVTVNGNLVDGYVTFTDDLLAHFEAGDLRKDATLQTGDWTSPISGKSFTAAQNEVRNIKLEKGTNANIQSTGDLNFLRYTDMYLYYAEVLGSSTGINGWTALSIVNKVRNRAGLAPLTSVTTNDILNERRSEFVMEGQRWWDQVRTNNMGGLKATYDVPDVEMNRMGL